MRKLLTATFAAAIMLMTVIPAMAQKGEMKLGPTINFGSSDAGSLGIGVKFVYSLDDKIDLVPEFIYYLKKDNLSQMLINADGTYTFSATNQYKFYGIGGLTVQMFKFETDEYSYVNYETGTTITVPSVSETSTHFGINAGAGVNYYLSDKMSLVGEARYVVISDYAQLLISAGVLFKL